MRRLPIGASLLLAICFASATDAPSAANADLIQHGRYLVRIAGCNDCHTAGFAPSGGKVPRRRSGCSATSSDLPAPGVRPTRPACDLRLANMEVAAFRAYARALVTRPPMPYWAVNAVSDRDLDALYAFVKSPGPAGEPAPAALPPGSAATGAVVRFPAAPPETQPPQRVARGRPFIATCAAVRAGRAAH
jgi:mono/diheme cytochrome c family protein